MPGGGGGNLVQTLQNLIPGATYTFEYYNAILDPPEPGTRTGACTLRPTINGNPIAQVAYDVAAPPRARVWEKRTATFGAPGSSVVLSFRWDCITGPNATPMAVMLDGISVVTTEDNCPVDG